MTSNLDRFEEFVRKEYRVGNNMISSKNRKNVLVNYFTWMTGVFESDETQKALSTIDTDVRGKLFQVYRGFREINDKAGALDAAFRPWRASLFIDAELILRTTFASLRRTSLKASVNELL